MSAPLPNNTGAALLYSKGCATRFRNTFALDLAALLMLAYSLCRVFLTTPNEKMQGTVQRIFYYHVPFAWVALFAFFMVFIFSILYLARRREWMDAMAVSNAEVGVFFCTLVLITGPLWAKPVWGVYWDWDARLTSTFVLWLIYLGYMLLRAFVHDTHRRAVLSAAVGIFGFLDVPLVYFSIRLFNTQHPKPVIAGGEGSGLAPVMRNTLFICLIAITLFYVCLLVRRYRLERLRQEAETLWEEAGA
ncbi:cytochrome c biogenesis protein CcsA [bacterium]|nr:cytochrome c biogenesis protein CcsA [bacterium]